MAKKLQIVSGRPFQADWDVTDEDNAAYIRNKPNFSDRIRVQNAILHSNLWSDESPCSQSIVLDYVTPNSKIDIQLNTYMMTLVSEENLRLSIKNDNGVVTVYSIGGKPSIDLDIQLTIIEVTKENELDVIWGNII